MALEWFLAVRKWTAPNKALPPHGLLMVMFPEHVREVRENSNLVFANREMSLGPAKI